MLNKSLIHKGKDARVDKRPLLLGSCTETGNLDLQGTQRVNLPV